MTDTVLDKPKPKAKAEQRFIINVNLGNDQEPVKIFVGADGADFLIERGKDVEVPARVLEVLDNAVMSVMERNGDGSKSTVLVHRKRFPYSVVRVL